jgi:hypothetical protein
MLFIAIVHFIGAALALLGSCLLLAGGAIGAGAASELGAGMGIMMAVMGVIVFLAGGILVYQGILLVQARGSFQAVVTTDHADQAHLNAGFQKLKIFFLIEVVLGVLGLIGNTGQIVALVVGQL